MTDRTQDHTATLEYQTTYFPELNPARLELMLANQRLRSNGGVVHACELGYGTGLSTVIHAAAANVQWWGTDYNPAHAQFANAMAGEGGVALTLLDQSFQEFCQRQDLPDFDFIALHGVWSWVSEANRTVIVDFIRRKLRVGGVVYLSCNALPGHAQMLPFRNLMKSYLDQMTPPGLGDVQRAELAFQFVKTMLDANPQLAEVYPLAKRTLDDLLHHPADSYLNHEYLVQHWTPMSFCDLAAALQDAKLTFACSAIPTHHYDDHFLVPTQQALLAQVPDGVTRETLRDVLVNRQFRQDYWIKGGLQLPVVQADEWARRARIVLVRTPASVSPSVIQAVFHTHIADTTLNALMAILSDGKAHCVADVLAQAKAADAGHVEDAPLRAILHLLGNGSIAVAQADEASQQVAERVLRLNAALCERALHSATITHLASAVTGGGVRVGQLHMQFLAFRFQGLRQPQDWARALAGRLQRAGVQLLRDGVALTALDDMVAHITELATAFANDELPLLQKLGCVP